MFSHNVTLAFYPSSSESSLAGVLVGYAHYGNGEWMQQQRVKLQNSTWEQPTKCPKRQFWVYNYTASSESRLSALRGCKKKFPIKLTYLHIVNPPRSILSICLCTYFKPQLVCDICWFFSYWKSNLAYKFRCIYMYYLLFGKTSVWDSESLKYNTLHT